METELRQPVTNVTLTDVLLCLFIAAMVMDILKSIHITYSYIG